MTRRIPVRGPSQVKTRGVRVTPESGRDPQLVRADLCGLRHTCRGRSSPPIGFVSCTGVRVSGPDGHGEDYGSNTAGAWTRGLALCDDEHSDRLR